jgi:gamma-glutamyltranspeptidase/glutathione hydrolase
MLNNMLGEEDLNARGFHRWPTGTRVSSMMSPTLAQSSDGDWYALGSGGSNRIRSAILQTLLHVLAAGRSLDDAVHRPRVHVENDHLSIEAGFPESAIARLQERFPEHHLWPGINLFFGGAHSVLRSADGSLDGAGDPRRGGVARFA